MLVPALAFAWWLVSLPAPSAETGRDRGDTRTRQEEVASESPENADTPEDDSAQELAEADEQKGGERVALKLVTPSIVRTARSLLDLPMGSERYMTIEGRHYVFVLERHYHPPGFVGAPNGWHKGVTAYELR